VLVQILRFRVSGFGFRVSGSRAESLRGAGTGPVNQTRTFLGEFSEFLVQIQISEFLVQPRGLYNTANRWLGQEGRDTPLIFWREKCLHGKDLWRERDLGVKRLAAERGEPAHRHHHREVQHLRRRDRHQAKCVSRFHTNRNQHGNRDSDGIQRLLPRNAVRTGGAERVDRERERERARARASERERQIERAERERAHTESTQRESRERERESTEREQREMRERAHREALDGVEDGVEGQVDGGVLEERRARQAAAVGESKPLPSQYGTHKTVKARFWPWLSGDSP